MYQPGARVRTSWVRISKALSHSILIFIHKVGEAQKSSSDIASIFRNYCALEAHSPVESGEKVCGPVIEDLQTQSDGDQFCATKPDCVGKICSMRERIGSGNCEGEEADERDTQLLKWNVRIVEAERDIAWNLVEEIQRIQRLIRRASGASPHPQNCADRQHEYPDFISSTGCEVRCFFGISYYH